MIIRGVPEVESQSNFDTNTAVALSTLIGTNFSMILVSALTGTWRMGRQEQSARGASTTSNLSIVLVIVIAFLACA